MKKSTLSILLSAFVYPGVGHFYLRYRKRGITYAITFSIFLYYIISFAYQQVSILHQGIISGEIALTRDAITRYMIDNIEDINQIQNAGYASYIMLLLWVICIFDTYRLAKTQPLSAP